MKPHLYTNSGLWKGSISLFTALIILTSSIFGLRLQRFSTQCLIQQYMNEWTFLKAQAVLARFDRTLLDNYGVWAYSSKCISEEELSLADVEGYKVKGRILPEIALGDEGIFRRQAVDFTREVCTVEIIHGLYERIKAISEGLKQNNSINIAHKIRGVIPQINRLELAERCVNNSKPLPRSGSSGGKREPATEEKTQGLDIFKAFFQVLYQTDWRFLNLDENQPKLPALLNKLSSVLKQEWPQLPRILDELYFREYIVSQFSSRVKGPSATHKLGKTATNLCGQKLSSMKHLNPYEAEFIVGPFALAKQNLEFVKGLIFSSRFGLHTAAQLNNDSVMAGYRAKAAVITEAVLLISVGEIELDSEMLAAFMAVIDAARMAIDDYTHLANGDNVPLYPDSENKFSAIKVSYDDYLRIISCFKSLSDLEARCVHTLEINYAQPFYCGVGIWASANKGGNRCECSCKRSYMQIQEY